MVSSTDGEVDIRRAHSLPDYLFLRSLRNQVRHSMTNSSGLIGYVQQARFYWSKPGNIDIHLARAGGRRVGYLLLRHEGDGALITEAVHPAFQRRGIAARLVRFAQDRCSQLTAEIFDDNLASIRLHEAAGFRLAGARGRVLVYRYARAGTD